MSTPTVLRADDLVAQACAATGLDDFGGDSFREGLAVYCEAVTTEARLNELGAQALPGNVVGSLSNRLRVVEYRKRHPEVAGEAIEAPLVVVGMFRAGTTLCSYLLDRDTANRSLVGWEARDSVPPPAPGEHRSGPRVEAVKAGQAQLLAIEPRFKVVQHEEPDGPTECISVMSQDFKSLSWEAIANVPTYSEWLLQVDQRSAYEYHRQVLQVLQHGGVRGRWSLKSPHHAIALEHLTAVYPDARLVLLHRDPVVLCASVCSLITTLSGIFTDADHSAYIATKWTDLLDTCIERIAAFRDANPTFPIVDVQYADLVRDPVGAIAGIYAAFGGELSPDARAGMAEHVRAHPQGEFGMHKYDLAQFGLDGPALAERFAGYRERYGVAEEHPAR
jgi:hypothetical protein